MKRFIRFVVENEHFTLLLALVVTLYGVTSLYEVNLAQDPEIDFPQIAVVLLLPGASPSEIERNVVFPVEAELRSLKDYQSVRTTVEHGHAEVLIKFRPGVDGLEKSRVVESQINKIRRRLPERLEFRVSTATLSDGIAAFVLAVHGGDPATRDNAAFDLVNVLSEIAHLKNIRHVKADEEVVVSLDATRLRWLGVSIDSVVEAIASDNAFSASGTLNLDGERVRFSGPVTRYRNPEDIGDTVVYGSGGNGLRLRDLARIGERAQGSEIVARHRSEPVAMIEVGVDSSQVNILDLARTVRSAVARFVETAPPGVRVEFVFDQSDGVGSLVLGLVESLVFGLGILVLVLLFSVGWRSTFIIASTLPLSFLTALAMFSFTGYGIQQVSLAGFIIAIGLIVDNGIVVTENAYLLQRYSKLEPREAAIGGASPAAGPLFASTLTTMLAFTPMFFLTSDAAVYLRSLSVSIWVSLLASLIMALTIVTLLLARVGTLGPVLGIPNPPSILIGLIPFRDGVYQRVLAVVLRWRATTGFVFLAALAYTLHLASTLELQVFPVTGDPYITVNVQLSGDTEMPHREEVAAEIERRLTSLDGFVSSATLIGRSFPWVNTSMNNVGDIVVLVRLSHGDAPRLLQSIEQAEGALRPLGRHGDINVFPFQQRDLTYQSSFALVVSGSDVGDLRKGAAVIDPSLREVEGVRRVRNPVQSSELAMRLDYDQQRALDLGVAKPRIDRLVNMLTYGHEVARLRDSRGREFPVLVGLESGSLPPSRVARELLVASAHGTDVPLSEVLTAPRLESAESRIVHVQFEPRVEIDVWVEDGYSAREVAARVLEAAERTEKPPGVGVDIGGALAQSTEDFASLGKHALVIGAVMFSILVLQFRSFGQPLVIFSAVPMCLIGAFSALALTAQPLTFFALVGVTSLMGIVVNDSILLVDEGNALRHERPELPLREIAIKAGTKRFMPVLLTSLTTIAGLIPMALGSSMFKTMAVAIIGGLFSSTLLILFLVPILYSILSPRAVRG